MMTPVSNPGISTTHGKSRVVEQGASVTKGTGGAGIGVSLHRGLVKLAVFGGVVKDGTPPGTGVDDGTTWACIVIVPVVLSIEPVTPGLIVKVSYTVSQAR